MAASLQCEGSAEHKGKGMEIEHRFLQGNGAGAEEIAGKTTEQVQSIMPSVAQAVSLPQNSVKVSIAELGEVMNKPVGVVCNCWLA